MGSGARFRPEARLTTGVQYRTVFKRGVRLDGPQFLLLAVPNGLAASRLGLAVARKVGPSVRRNRTKRLLREGFRRNRGKIPRPVDLVLVAKREIVTCAYGEVESEYRKRLRRLSTRRGFGALCPSAAASD